MFRQKKKDAIPMDVGTSQNLSCTLSKYIIPVQNDDLQKSDTADRTKAKQVRAASVPQLNDSTRVNVDKFNMGIKVGNTGQNESNNDSTQFEQENNNNGADTVDEKQRTIVSDSRKLSRVDEGVRLGIGEHKGIDNVAFEHEFSGDIELKHLRHDKDKVSQSNLKRSLSFGDKPRRRDVRHGKAGGHETTEPVAFCKDTDGEGSSSADSAFSGDTWRLTLEEFTSKRVGSKRKERRVSKQMRSFYKSQDDLIDQYEEIRMDLHDVMDAAETERKLRKKASNYAKATFAVNLVLLIIKIVAVVLSGSISLISSLVDSSVDLLSGVVIWVTTRAVKKTNRYIYPQGRTKLEPLAIVILAVIMSVASLQIIKESFTKIIGLANKSSSPPVMDGATIGIASATVVIKLVLYILCRRVNHPTVQALALDHRNDVLSNFVAIVFGYLGSEEMQTKVDAPGLVYIDPIGAILISIYIIVNWVITGWDQIKLLIGHTATAAFISKLTWICVDHHKKILKVDTVRAFHFGHNFLVEVDIVLPPEMTVQEAHDIAEPLQQKLERLTNVERAFVHVDYEVTHNPKLEHKVV